MSPRINNTIGLQREAMSKTEIARVYQIKVTLEHIEPPIWRQLLVPSSCTLGVLHETLQVAMGWTDSHMHHFIGPDRTIYGADHPDSFGNHEDEARVRLSAVLVRERQRLLYEYDFGDGWLHQIVLEKIRDSSEAASLPRCIAGARACPPEDCGGVPGYERLFQIVDDPEHPEHDEMLEWLGKDFDPERFDIDEVNAQLMPRGRRQT